MDSSLLLSVECTMYVFNAADIIHQDLLLTRERTERLV